MAKRTYIRGHFRGGAIKKPEPVVIERIIYKEPRLPITICRVRGEPKANCW